MVTAVNIPDAPERDHPRRSSARSFVGAADWLALGVAAVTVIFLAVLAGGRTLAGYGTENDFIGSMVPEAARLLAGEPLLSSFHPPFYPVVLSGAYRLTGEWLAAGKAVTLASSAVTLVCSHLLFRLLAGPWAGFGAVLGLISAPVFLTYSLQATSDVFALALYSATFLAAAVAATRRSVATWALVGALALLTLMARTNGLTLVALLAIPLIQPGLGYRLGAVLAGIAGYAAAIVPFAAFAALTGSNLMPEGTYHNLALTYFTEERVSWEGMVEARARFDSLGDVLLHDPAAIARGYVRDLIDVALARAPQLAGPVLALLFLPGLILALAPGRRRALLLAAFLLATLGQLLLVNFKAYEPRYHMYLAPWIGAGAAILIASMAGHRDWPLAFRRAVLGVLAPLAAYGPLSATQAARAFAAPGGNPELAVVLPEVRGILGPGDLVFARKSHIAFYTGAQRLWMDEVDTGEELEALLAGASEPGVDVHVFVGEVERRVRPGVVAAARSGQPWLVPVAEGTGPREWTLYRYAPGDRAGGGAGDQAGD
jgi:hypothetical protein